jgi:hypothetical protein
MGEMLFRVFFPAKARELSDLRDHLLNVVLFPRKNEVKEYKRRIREDYQEAESIGFRDAFLGQ